MAIFTSYSHEDAIQGSVEDCEYRAVWGREWLARMPSPVRRCHQKSALVMLLREFWWAASMKAAAAKSRTMATTHGTPASGHGLRMALVPLDLEGTRRRHPTYASIGIVRYLMAGQRAGVASAIVGNRQAAVGTHHVDVEIYQPLARDVGRRRAYAVSSVTDGAREAVPSNVIVVIAPTGIGEDLRQVVALGAHGVRAVYAQVRIGEGVGDQPSRHRGL